MGSSDRGFYALDQASGDLKWRFQGGGAFESAPSIADGVAYIGGNDGRLYTLHAQDGSLLWQYQAKNMIRSTPALGKSVIFVGSDDGTIYGVERATGALVGAIAPAERSRQAQLLQRTNCSSARPTGACTRSVWSSREMATMNIRRRNWLWLLILAIVVIALGAGAFASWHYRD